MITVIKSIKLRMERKEKRVLNEIAKSINTCQPAQSAQADMGRNFSLSSNFLHVKGLFCLMIPTVSGQRGFHESKIKSCLSIYSIS